MTENLRLYYTTVPLFVLVLTAHKFTDGALSASGALLAVPIALAVSTDLILVYLLDQAVLTPMAKMRDGERSWTLCMLRAALQWIDDRFHKGSGSDHSSQSTDVIADSSNNGTSLTGSLSSREVGP